MNYRIVVPSRERARWLSTRKRSMLNCVKTMNPVFMVRDDDSQKVEYFIYARERGVEPTIYDGTDIYGAAQTYDCIIEQAIKDGVERLMILDDDLWFKMKNPILFAKPDFKFTTASELSTLLSHAASLVCPELPLLSFTPIMARMQRRLITFCKRIMMAYVIYVPHFKEHLSHRFWQGIEIEARCDLNLSLKLLTEGFLTAFMSTLYITDNVNNPGGCSVYRDLECERASVEYLKSRYPSFVKTFKKRGWMDDDSIIRDAPKITWKRAFNHELFKERFDESAVTFANKMNREYEEVYSDFIKELRNETERPDTRD